MHGNSQFDKHLADWLAALGVPSGSDALESTVARAQKEILYDVESGALPRTVKSFAELHDYVDANGYGDAFRWPELPSEMDDEPYVSACVEFWDRVHGRLHAWIASGRMLADLAARGDNGSACTGPGASPNSLSPDS